MHVVCKLTAAFLVATSISSCAVSISANSRAKFQGGSATTSVRPCKPESDEYPGKKKSSSSKKKDRSAVLQAEPACIEVHERPLFVQEFLQKAVRDLRWAVADEQASEDFWNFSMPIEAQELAAYTKPSPELRVVWKAGKASVNVRTSELAGGYTRLLITAKFEGYGEQEDAFAPKRESWTLVSSGGLEARLINILRDRATAGH